MRVAVDLGGTKIAVARVQGARVLERRSALTPAAEGPDAVVAAIAALLDGWSLDGGLAVAATGRVHDGVVHAVNRATLPGWEAFPLADALRVRTGARAVILNDAHAAAFGEARHGAGVGLRDFLFVTVSTGVGAGVIAAGQLLRGARGLAGHVGFVRNATADGFLELHASGTAIERAARHAIGDAITPRAVFAAAEAGDPRAEAVIRSAVAALARALRDARWLLDPERVAIGGSVGLASGYLARLRAALAELEPDASPLDLVPAALGGDAGLIGAAAFAAESAAHPPAAQPPRDVGEGFDA
jgi:predicted NBD/HSP70 family sugar kinase